MDLVNNHNKKPSFSNKPSEMVIGSSITLTDNNGVLENYEVSDVKGATITKNGNNLTITATEVGDMSFKLVKLGIDMENQLDYIMRLILKMLLEEVT